MKFFFGIVVFGGVIVLAYSSVIRHKSESIRHNGKGFARQGRNIRSIDVPIENHEEILLYIPDDEEARILSTIPEIESKDSTLDESILERHKRSLSENEEEGTYIYIPDHEEEEILKSVPELPINFEEATENNERHKRSLDESGQLKSENNDHIVSENEDEGTYIYIPDHEEEKILKSIPELPVDVEETDNTKRHKRSVDENTQKKTEHNVNENEEEGTYIYIPDHEEEEILKNIPELPVEEVENAKRPKRSLDADTQFKSKNNEHIENETEEEGTYIYIPDDAEEEILKSVPELPVKQIENTKRHKRSLDANTQFDSENLQHVEEEGTYIYIPDYEEEKILKSVPELPIKFEEIDNVERYKRLVDEGAQPKSKNLNDEEEAYIHIPDLEEEEILKSVPELPINFEDTNETKDRQKRSVNKNIETGQEDDEHTIYLYIPDDEEENILAKAQELPDNLNTNVNREKRSTNQNHNIGHTPFVHDDSQTYPKQRIPEYWLGRNRIYPVNTHQA